MDLDLREYVGHCTEIVIVCKIPNNDSLNYLEQFVQHQCIEEYKALDKTRSVKDYLIYHFSVVYLENDFLTAMRPIKIYHFKQMQS